MFIPHPPDDVDMNINSRAIIDIDSVTSNETNSLSSSMPETQDDFNGKHHFKHHNSKKLATAPAGLVDLIDDSGR